MSFRTASSRVTDSLILAAWFSCAVYQPVCVRVEGKADISSWVGPAGYLPQPSKKLCRQLSVCRRAENKVVRNPNTSGWLCPSEGKQSANWAASLQDRAHGREGSKGAAELGKEFLLKQDEFSPFLHAVSSYFDIPLGGQS